MRIRCILLALLPCVVSAQQFPTIELPEYSGAFANIDLALGDVELAQAGAVISLERIRQRHDRISKEGLEAQVQRLPKLGAGIGKSDRAWPHVEGARSAWAGFLGSTASVAESGSAFAEANSAASRLAKLAKELGVAGAAREAIDQPGAQRLAVVREAERRFQAARSERIRALLRARSLEAEIPKIQALRRQAASEALASSSTTSARQADLLSARASKVASDAVLAYAEAARHAAYELRMAQVMADNYAELSSESVGRSIFFGSGR